MSPDGIVTSGKSKHCDLQLSCDIAEGLAVVRVLLGYVGMITSSAATLVAIMAASVIYTADHITIGLFFLAFLNPISIIAFIGAALFALIFSSVPFTIFIILGGAKHIRCLSWYMTAALVTVVLFFCLLTSEYILNDQKHRMIFTDVILNTTLAVVQAAVGTFAYWKIAGRFAGTTDEQMYGPF